MKRISYKTYLYLFCLVIFIPRPELGTTLNYRHDEGAKKTKFRNRIKIAFFADLGAINIENGKPEGLDFFLVNEWSKRNGVNIDWVFVSSVNRALKLLAQRNVSMAVGNIPRQERNGFIYSLPIRKFKWVKYGRGDSLFLLSDYPKPSIILEKSNTYPLSIKKEKMWRHSNFNNSGWLLPDYLAKELFSKTSFRHNIDFLGKGEISWVCNSRDSSMINSVNNMISDPSLRKKIRFFQSYNFKSNFQNQKNISDYDEQLKDRIVLDKHTLNALIFTESRFKNNVVSHAGAIGLMQLLPRTAKSIGIDSIQLFDGTQNIRAGLKYINYLNEYWELKGVSIENRIPFILSSYNSGPSAIFKETKEAQKLGLNPKLWDNNVAKVHKSNYVEKIMKLASIYRGYEKSVDEAKH
jgi:hypothetical protein